MAHFRFPDLSDLVTVRKNVAVGAIFCALRDKVGVNESMEIVDLPTHKKVELGIAMVPEGKNLFPNRNVYENLAMGAYVKRAIPGKKETMDLVFDLIPRLKERIQQKAGSLSGGEQQMLTIGRSLMTQPSFIMLEEPR